MHVCREFKETIYFNDLLYLLITQGIHVMNEEYCETRRHDGTVGTSFIFYRPNDISAAVTCQLLLTTFPLSRVGAGSQKSILSLRLIFYPTYLNINEQLNLLLNILNMKYHKTYCFIQIQILTRIKILKENEPRKLLQFFLPFHDASLLCSR